jgi:ABC-type lipoprotein export system ATPase subunit
MSPAPLVVMDEPTSARPGVAHGHHQAAEEAASRFTLLVVTHDPVVKQMAKNVIEMSENV